MNTTVVCGTLGAGKTTYLQSIIKKSDADTVVLVNDFGSAGIDGDILSAGGIETIELKSGCVCCSLRFELLATLETVLQKYKPKFLYIEPSGVASPSAVLEVLQQLHIAPITVIGLLDATAFAESYESGQYGWFFKSQVTCSDLILVNKADLVDRAKLEYAVSLAAEINPAAVLVTAINAVPQQEVSEIRAGLGGRGTSLGHSLDLQTVSISLDNCPDPGLIEAFFAALKAGDYGKVMRAKGLVRTTRGPYRYDLASGQIKALKFEEQIADSRIVIIGEDLDEERIRRFQEF
ncbi:GTP-binding protein [bacterium]|nr:GTP-binding protein [bacterium]